MLIVEGTDLVGKTTLCRQLVETLNALGRPHTYSWLGLLPRGWDYHWDYVARMVNPVVQDRFYLSEAAYSVAARREPRLGTRELDLLDAELRVRGGFTVLLLAHDEVLEELYARKTQPELFELDVIRRANAMFRGLAQRTQHVYTLGSYPDYDEARRIVDEYVTWQDYVRETWKRDTRRSS